MQNFMRIAMVLFIFLKSRYSACKYHFLSKTPRSLKVPPCPQSKCFPPITRLPPPIHNLKPLDHCKCLHAINFTASAPPDKHKPI